jgi:hypothetical protein
MTDEWIDDEGSLLAALDDALSAARSVPQDFVAAGKACFAWHGIDAELAQLTSDSSAQPGLAATARAESAVIRALTFVAPRLTIELEIGEDALRGQLVPHQTGELELQLVSGEKTGTRADDLGYFVFARVPTVSFRLYCRTEDEVVVTTTWLTL